MRLTRGRTPACGESGAGSAAGFSLLEAVVACALLLVTVTAVTMCVSAVSGSARRDHSAQRAERALCSVSEWLASLPYCPAELPAPAAGRGQEAADLVAAVFPHACTWDDEPGARYVAVDEGEVAAGSFVTRFVHDGVEVVCAARFLGPDGLALRPSLVEGFHLASSWSVPGAALEVELTAPAAAGQRWSTLMRTAGADADLDPEEVL